MRWNDGHNSICKCSSNVPVSKPFIVYKLSVARSERYFHVLGCLDVNDNNELRVHDSRDFLLLLFLLFRLLARLRPFETIWLSLYNERIKHRVSSCIRNSQNLVLSSRDKQAFSVPGASVDLLGVLAYTGDLTLVLFVEEDEGPLLSADGKDRLVDGPDDEGSEVFLGGHVDFGHWLCARCPDDDRVCFLQNCNTLRVHIPLKRNNLCSIFKRHLYLVVPLSIKYLDHSTFSTNSQEIEISRPWGNDFSHAKRVRIKLKYLVLAGLTLVLFSELIILNLNIE